MVQWTKLQLQVYCIDIVGYRSFITSIMFHTLLIDVVKLTVTCNASEA